VPFATELDYLVTRIVYEPVLRLVEPAAEADESKNERDTIKRKRRRSKTAIVQQGFVVGDDGIVYRDRRRELAKGDFLLEKGTFLFFFICDRIGLRVVTHVWLMSTTYCSLARGFSAIAWVLQDILLL
jgi:hypothetical protein